MKEYALIIILFLSTSISAIAQKQEENVYLDIWNLLFSKIDYEKYYRLKNSKKADSALAVYKKNANKIKASPDVYLDYIKHEMRNNIDKLQSDFLPYKYGHNLHFKYDPGGYYIRKIDLYRLIKYSFFNQNKSYCLTIFLIYLSLIKKSMF